MERFVVTEHAARVLPRFDDNSGSDPIRYLRQQLGKHIAEMQCLD